VRSSPLSVVIHGHFYQPPRDDPWLETVEAQPSAAPYHDWNQRIESECYRAVVAARIPGPDGRIASIVNTLEKISFNFGPTLLEWLEAHAPRTYEAILAADRTSTNTNRGHGNAIAQAYHHTILPLASRREKETEVRWGIADFRNRFGREPTGMWLPETALDDETLDVLAREGIAFTIVAPHQVKDPPPGGLPGVYRTRNGRSIALFVYDGPLSHGVAFGSLLQDAGGWARAIGERAVQPVAGSAGIGGGSAASSPALVSIATDGETYGHHHRFGDMALAAALDLVQRDPLTSVENFSSFLHRNPPVHPVELVEPSSWSCAHGVDRWKAECGCKMDPSSHTQQEWRSSLRTALEWLADQIHEVYVAEGTPLLGDPWAARDRYGSGVTPGVRDPRALELLELERQALRLFTSCGWFFDDLAGIEPLQVLLYAARALELIGPAREKIEEGFLERLESAHSNENPSRSGREIFLAEAKPSLPAHLRVAAGAALLEALAEETIPPQAGVPGFEVHRTAAERLRIVHRRTRREWRVESRILQPFARDAAVAVRTQGEDEFVDLGFHDLPEDFQDSILLVLGERVPDPEEALLAAIEALHPGHARSDTSVLGARMDDVLTLAGFFHLLGEPIPFDAQTAFSGVLQEVPAPVERQLGALREPLGFTPIS
jgi:hypothetical protein